MAACRRGRVGSALSRPKIRFRPASELFAEELAEDPLGDFYTRWDTVTSKDVTALRTAIETASREEDIQAFLRAHPLLLIQHLGGSHGRWVLPKPRLGNQYVPDFIIGDRDSGGRRWVAIELEGTTRLAFTKAGDPSRHLTRAIRQILDWRAWLTANRPYAIAPPDGGRLGSRGH